MERTKIPGQTFGLPDIGIPFEVLFHPKLTNTEKMLYGFIRNLTHSEKGCYATNEYLGGLLNLTKNHISKAINNLKTYGVIEVEQEQQGPRTITLNPEYNNLFIRMLSDKGYKGITNRVMINAYPPMHKSLAIYYTTYNIKDVNKSTPENKFKFSRNVILQKLPEDWRESPKLLESINDWLIVRKEKKSSPTKRACELTGMDLAKYSLSVAIEALHISAKNGWTGVFPEKIKVSQKETDFNTTESPEELILNYFKGSYGKKFYQYFQSAEHGLSNQSNGQGVALAKNMLSLRKDVKRKQLQKAIDNMSIPSPGEVVFKYIKWLEDQNWLDTIHADLYTEDHTIFRKFSRLLSGEIGADIYNGMMLV